MLQDRHTIKKYLFAAIASASLCFVILSLPARAVNAQSVSDIASKGSSAFRLIGTMEGKHLSGAVLQDTSGQQSFYQLYEKLPDGSEVVKVNTDSILLKRSDGAAYELYIGHGTTNVASASSVPSNPYVAAQSTPLTDPYVAGRAVEPEQPNQKVQRHKQMRKSEKNPDD